MASKSLICAGFVCAINALCKSEKVFVDLCLLFCCQSRKVPLQVSKYVLCLFSGNAGG